MFCLTCTKVRFTISPYSLVLHSQRLMDLADPGFAYIYAGEDSVSQLTKKYILTHVPYLLDILWNNTEANFSHN